MQENLNKVSIMSLLVTLGIVFGDIGTSPLYVFTAITQGNTFDEVLVLGSLSCIFWTLLIIATFKYIYLALNADNHGEGGIFALYALLRRTKSKWIIYPALIGCATLISDGFITPAISISSAVEGLSLIYPDISTLPIVVAIVIGLFLIQQFGTKKIGGFFGPVMLIWFLTLGTLGALQLIKNPEVLKAINPVYAFSFLYNYPKAIWVLGAVFLCSTGAEALYSDLGHCGKKNIRIAWTFVLSMLLLNYFGQAAFCLSMQGKGSVDSVFYATVPDGFLYYVIGIATLSTIIASQALITGIFTLVNEAIKLKLWTNLKVKYPSTHKGQIYIPAINYFLLFGCLLVIFIFKKASNMEAAYGLAITIDMIMTSILLGFLLRIRKRKLKRIYAFFVIVFFSIEFTFLISNLNKIPHGGWFTLLLASFFFLLLLFYNKAKRLRSKFAEYQQMVDIKPMLISIQDDIQIPFYATNIVYPTRSSNANLIDRTIVHSLFYMQPKKAKVYWFLHLNITDMPHEIAYEIETLIPKRAFFVTLNLGFKEPHLIDYFIKKIYQDLIDSGEIIPESAFKSLIDYKIPTDFKYVLINSRAASENELSLIDIFTIKLYRILKSSGLTIISDFGLESANIVEEKIPINVSKINNDLLIKRI
ncbi:KUP/HAK/KT family potassium transporter [Polaribacter glomeratus]|uniref:Potassium transport system protein kup n=1 Tax=Polaribacter glomeratus TaxID=102 RepID=A0A2S7WV34_9FLAO|nr:KUP/HAK/KT family potassium transporter [Polaribacter glomeratus]PQJ81455.1 hypothetical protein BTO16_02170 [Polaribacter glomeratus]TXD64744.1 KUP/HAK/KT family potassium transporter [Polaribacter glomeratus]